MIRLILAGNVQTKPRVSRKRRLAQQVHSAVATPKKANAPGGNRTPDLRLRRPLLYPTELLAHATRRVRVRDRVRTRHARGIESLRARPRERPRFQSGREDLNLRPPAPKAGALPGCATPRLHSLVSFYAAAPLHANLPGKRQPASGACGNRGLRKSSNVLIADRPIADEPMADR